MSRFANQFDYDLGSLDNQPQQRESFLIENQYENDIYEFDTSSSLNINLSLNSLESGDDADLYLYEDSNNNGILDEEDYVLSSSVATGGEDNISLIAERGKYFARVSYSSSEIDDRIDYNLELSADITGTESSIDKDFGYSLVGEQAALETGSINDQNTSDTYALSVASGEVIDITLAGLSSDADLRVVQDTNQNDIVDEAQIYASATSPGTNTDIVSLNEPGDYLVEVYQFSGNTDYTLQFDQEFV